MMHPSSFFGQRSTEHRMLPALVRVPRMVSPWRLVVALAVLLVVGMVAMAWLPWQQNVAGQGRVIAWAQVERMQDIHATIDGRVERWYVQEGDHVNEGDPLVLLVDNDSDLTDRLDAERQALVLMLGEYESRARNLDERITALRIQRDAALASARAQVRAAEQRVRGAQEDLDAASAALLAAELQLTRTQTLRIEGLASERDLELAQLEEARTRTARNARRAALDTAIADRESRVAELARVDASTDAEIRSAEAAWRSGMVDIESQRASILRLDTRVARQATQLITAPRDGMVFRMLIAPGAQQIRMGTPLLTLVPDNEERAVEVIVDGNDAPLIFPGRHVRLQFEGWPAVQFTGWPQVAVGTFGGEVAFVDAADDGYGNFRVVIVPGPDEDWPEGMYLRQGVRAKAWIMLDVVSLGYEVWRLFNGFPPAVEQYYDKGSDYPASLRGKKS